MAKYKTPVVMTADEGNEHCLRFPASIVLSRVEIVAISIDNDIGCTDAEAVKAAVRMYLDSAIGDVVHRMIADDRIEVVG